MQVVERLRELSRNLWWTWQPGLVALFRDIDPERWRRVQHNPVAFLAGIPDEKVSRAVKDQALEARINQAFHSLESYASDTGTWGRLYAGPLQERPVAYFSAEFGLHESLPIYSGGLGILAGDHLATASDFGIPLIGVGLFYARGYFTQHLDEDGAQQESHDETDVAQLPLQRATTADGGSAVVEVEIGGRSVSACIWQADVGRCSLILLDCDIDRNPDEDRDLTDRLYDADPGVRIRQEAVLGIGGMRALRLLGFRPSVMHLNEGHSAFAILERVREEMEENQVDVEEAERRVRGQTVFTTHTPVEAGHDRFDLDLFDETLAPLRKRLGLSKEGFRGLGQPPGDRRAPYCMTTLALRMSRRSNAVSALHARTARRMWQVQWPDRSEDEVPIDHITNGVHISSWLAPPLHRFYDEHLGPDWEARQCAPETWAAIKEVDDERLWEVHQILKVRLLESIFRWVRTQEERRGNEGAGFEALQEEFRPKALMIAFARRFATYKRADLIFADEERLAALVNDRERPVRLVFAGKAHPRDEEGKELIRRIFHLAESDEFRGRLAFIEDYDINTARHLVQGCDVWLNTPLRTREACGTSGMKAVFNGVLNLSVQDGWWAEAYDGTNGFSIGEGEAHSDPGRQRERDAKALYETLENEVIPAYYDTEGNGVPRQWVGRMKNALATLAWRFNSDRMMMEYAEDCYLPAAGIKTVDAQSARRRSPTA